MMILKHVCGVDLEEERRRVNRGQARSQLLTVVNTTVT
jgi:hypothetical protein